MADSRRFRGRSATEVETVAWELAFDGVAVDADVGPLTPVR